MPSPTPLRRTAVSAAAGAVLLGLLAAPAAAQRAAAADPGLPTAVAADGATATIDALDPSSRAAGVLALYTPDSGAETKTNAFGGEAVLRAVGGGAYDVLSVCTALDSCPKPGNNAIPADGAVLSASPPEAGGVDDRRWLREHLHAGDRVQLRNLLIRRATATLDATDPTAATNPPGVDPAKGECFPGCRGAEQLVAYTPAAGRERTGTNDYGFEIGVRDGRVVSRQGGDSAIPAGGFVLSGHGSRGSWLEGNAPLGAKVTVDGAAVTVEVDAQSFLLGAERAVTAARAGKTAAVASCLDIDPAAVDAALAEATELLTQARAAADSEPERAAELARDATRRADVAGYRSRESRPVEGRGLWVRPIETSPEQIRASLDRISAAGFNMVFLETVWGGYTIYPSAVAERAGMPAQRPEMRGFDPLKVWIDEAHSRGIELHAWTHTFFVGVESGGGPVLTAHPGWAAVEREDVGKAGPQPSRMEPGYYWMDAAVPAVRTHVLATFEEILRGYAVDGLHLDYIRYPVSLPYGADFSYSAYSRTTFAAEHGVDPYTLTPDSPQWPTWNAWREKQITTFVDQVRTMQRRVAADRQLSAAVFADPTDGLAKKFQNWGAWVDAGTLDFLTGMSFGTSADSVGHDTAVMRERVGDVPLYTATYGPLRGTSPDLMLDQVQAVNDADSDGAALFAYNQLNARQQEALREGTFRTRSVVPHADYRKAARAGVAALRTTLKRATACAPAATTAAVRARLVVAERLLADGMPAQAVDAAAKQLAKAAASASSWGDAVPAELSRRTTRDLRMYARWADLA
ncbi:family 10 glycosylhydrolase [Micromonospora sp. WMMC241]|uniref:glycoside hydrolase family 10 protein n=1 Tax=Micromonospora sp. WMMC241 TaxID=3015159 RepID=UPI0022B72A97|nr:family 10 glycosylhydrolase [Micromonospora sp. WMMC241]MCZ7438803.1 family 10 glycosylhydrolase [Micromonospora sp. WMMC241]